MIDAKLDARARTLAGRETLVWTNIANAETRELRFHLYYNAWRNNQSTYMKEVRLGGGWSGAFELENDELAAIDITSLKATAGAMAAIDLTKDMRFIAP